MAGQPTKPTSTGVAILRVFWDMRWYFLGFAALMVGIHYAFALGGFLFFNGRGLTTTGTLLAAVFVGMILWGFLPNTRKRLNELEKRVKELEAEKKPPTS